MLQGEMVEGLMDGCPASRRRPRRPAISFGTDCDVTALDHRLGEYASRVDSALRRARQWTDTLGAEEAPGGEFEPSPSDEPAAASADQDEAATVEAARQFLSDRWRRLGLGRLDTTTTCDDGQAQTQQRHLEAVADALLNFPSSSSAPSLAELSRLCSAVYEANAVRLATVEDGLVHCGGGGGSRGHGGCGAYGGTEARRAAIAALEGRHRHQQQQRAACRGTADCDDDDCDDSDNDDDDAATLVSLGSLGTEEEMLTDGIIGGVGVGLPPPLPLEAICEGEAESSSSSSSGGGSGGSNKKSGPLTAFCSSQH